MRSPLWLLLLAVPVDTASAQSTQAFCDGLRRVVDAAVEAPPFNSLKSAPVALAGFDWEGADCSVEADSESTKPMYSCMSIGSPAQLNGNALREATLRCYPDARHLDSSEPGEQVLELGTVQVTISDLDTQGTEYQIMGRTIFYFVRTSR